jgi:hypothetical protein
MCSNTVYKDYLMDWLRGKRHSISRHTLQVCESFIRHQINPMIDELTLAQLNPMVLQQFVSRLLDQHSYPFVRLTISSTLSRLSLQ